jgi:hypothetical protein
MPKGVNLLVNVALIYQLLPENKLECQQMPVKSRFFAAKQPHRAAIFYKLERRI